MRIYLAVTPDNLREAACRSVRLAHAAYRIDPRSHLIRQEPPFRAEGDLMLLSDEGSSCTDRQNLCREVLRECGSRGFSGVAADFTQPPTPDRRAFLSSLNRALQQNRLTLFLPEEYAAIGGTALLCTALSGGSFRRRLEETVERYGANRVALDLQRLCMRFPLPCPEGEGEPLTQEAFSDLFRQLTPSVFYSSDLCARYFTYSQNGKHFFVLFDDADTLLQKVRIGQELGVATGFFMYPEVSDLLTELFPRSPRPQRAKNNR